MTTPDKVQERLVGNDACFQGNERAFWFMKAQGFDPRYKRTKKDEKLVLELDTDDFAKQNGGMYAPQETRMPPAIYYRFTSSSGGNPFGNWWLDAESYYTIRSFAQDNDLRLSIAAQRCLVVPEQWGNCGELVKAFLTRQLKAYVGKGKAATGTVSPYNEKRDPESEPIHIPVGHLQIKQWYVPGKAADLKEAFQIKKSIRVMTKGRFL